MIDQIQLKCAKCGSYDLESPANPKPDDIITCTGCGAKARFSEAEKQVHNLAEDIMSKAFSKFR